MPQEFLCVGIAATPHRDFGQHAQCRRVAWILFQVRAQQSLCVWQAVLADGRRRSQQPGTASFHESMVGVGGVRAGRIPHLHEVVGDQAPGLADVRLQPDGALQRLQCGLAAAEQSLDDAQFIVSGRPAGLRVRKRLEDRERAIHVTQLMPCDAEKQRCQRMTGDRPQQRACLRCGERRLRGAKETCNLIQRSLERSALSGGIPHFAGLGRYPP